MLPSRQLAALQVEKQVAELVSVRDRLSLHEQMAPSKRQWGRRVERVKWASERDCMEAEVQEREEQLVPELRELVESLFDKRLRRARRTTRHRYHPELLEVLPEVAALMVKRALTMEWGVRRDVGSPLVRRTRFMTAQDVPEIEGEMTQRAAEDYLVSRIAEYAEVATDPKINRIPGDDGSLKLEHKGSGIAIEVWEIRGRPGLGGVTAGRHKVCRGEDDREDYQGLGIGQMLYRDAAVSFPDMRWRSNVTNRQASGLRRALHREDPWRWEWDACEQCRGATWVDRGCGDFDDHPSVDIAGDVDGK